MMSIDRHLCTDLYISLYIIICLFVLYVHMCVHNELYRHICIYTHLISLHITIPTNTHT